MKTTTGIILVLVLACVSGLAQSISLVNASFETPSYTTGNWSYLASDGVTGGWTFTGAGHGGITAAFSPWIDAVADGSEAALLQGQATMSQTFTVTTAGNYYINFMMAQRPKYNPENLALQIDGVTLAYWPATSIPSGSFNDFNTNVVLAIGTHTLSFVATSPGGDTSVIIDKVTMSQPKFTTLAIQGGIVLQTDGSDTDTQAAINAAGNGYTVVIPAGNFVWTNGVKVSGKAIKIVGAGAGALFGNSTTPVTVGSGVKNFVVHSSGFATVTNGMTVTAFYTAAGDAGGLFGSAPTNMTGTVQSFDGTNLALNVTNYNGSGTIAFWTFGTQSATIITNNCTAGPMIQLFEPASGILELTGIHVINSLTSSSTANALNIEDGAGMAAVHDCRFQVVNGARAILTHCNHGIIYRCSFDNRFDSGIGHNGFGNNGEALCFKSDWLTASWTNNSTMGMDDLGGTNNFYVEDCYEAGFWTGGTDFDDNSRVVFRHCILDNSVCSSHGEDTSPYGLRHFELYNNQFVFTDAGVATYNLNWWLFLRGGTGVIFSNIMPNIASSTWGDKGELTFVVMYPYRDGCVTNYPSPHQIGQSWSNGVPIVDPVYYWGNAQLPSGNPGVGGYGPGDAESCYSVNGYPAGKPDQTNAPPISRFLQAGRDFTNAVKAGYTAYYYPHPIRSSITNSVISQSVTTTTATNTANNLTPPQQLRVQ